MKEPKIYVGIKDYIELNNRSVNVTVLLNDDNKQNVEGYNENIEQNKKAIGFQERTYAPGYYLARRYINAHFGKIIAECLPDNKHMLGFTIPINSFRSTPRQGGI